MPCKGLLVLFLVTFLVGDAVSHQRGTLFLNEIQGYPDPIEGTDTLPIECTLWDGNLVYLDNFDSLTNSGVGRGSGVDVDGVLIVPDRGTWVFPSTFDVAGTVTILGLMQVQGGFLADDGDFGDADGDGFDWAFELYNDSGDVTIAGSLEIDIGGLTNSKNITNPYPGTFRVNEGTGENTILGLFQPDGSVNIANGQITIASDGEFFAVGSATLEQDLILGTDQPEVRALVPFSNAQGSSPVDGGDTILKGQDAVDFGGSIVLQPGSGVNSAETRVTGDIVLGLNDVSDALSIRRFAATAGNGGVFEFGGQDTAGNGGDLILQGGDAIVSGFGGDVIFAPGESSSFLGVDGLRGFLYLGDPADGPNVPYYVERPEVTNAAHAGHTFITGQNVTTGNAGETIIAGGDGRFRGGNVHLEPGTSENRQGQIFFGTTNLGGNNLNLVRDSDPISTDLAGGPTWLIGQTSTGGDGGDLIIEAGQGTTSNGDLYLSPGFSNQATPSGTIFWGTNDGEPELRVVRPVSKDNPAHDTRFIGQSNSGGAGGDLVIEGGDGFGGGDVHLQAGFGEEDYGGEVVIRGGDGDALAASTGGSVTISSALDTAADSGDIFLIAGDGGFGADAGSIFISSIGENVNFDTVELFLDSIPLFVDMNNGAAPFIVRNTFFGRDLTISPVSSANGFFNLVDPVSGVTSPLLQDRVIINNSNFRPIFNPQDIDEIVAAANRAILAMGEIRAGLRTHGLIN